MPASPTEHADPYSPARRLAPPTRPRWVPRALDVVKGLVLGTVVSVGAAAHVQADGSGPAPVAPVASQLETLMADHRCSTTGLPDGTIPAAALLRTPSGRLRVVSFARGWAAHEGVQPGELVAVCLGGRGVLR